MATLRIDDFQAALSNGGARSNLFRATIYWPNAAVEAGADKRIGAEKLNSFMIKTAQLPGSTINSIPVPFRGRTLKVSGDRDFADWSVNIVNDNNFLVRNAMERWHDYMSGAVSNIPGGGLDTMNFSTYTANLEVEQLDRFGRPIKLYRLMSAWPTEVSPIELSYDVGEVEEFSVNFTYQWFETDVVLDPTSSGFATPTAFNG
jgi:hypothetical protein